MNRRATVAALTAIMVATSACGATAETAVQSDTQMSAVDKFADVASATEVVVGAASVHEAGAANDAIDFVAVELFSQIERAGLDLLGSGAAIVTFVQPGCDFSRSHSELLVDAAGGDIDVTYVFVHSGGTAAAFSAYASDVGLVEENMIHLDDRDGTLSTRFGVEVYPSTLLVDGEGRLSSSTGALDEVRLERALSIVSSTED